MSGRKRGLAEVSESELGFRVGVSGREQEQAGVSGRERARAGVSGRERGLELA